MKKGLKIFLNILKTIIAIPLGIIGAILLLPFVAIGLIISLPVAIIGDIWDIGTFPEENHAPYEVDGRG